MSEKFWVEECFEGIYKMGYLAKERLFSKKSEFQKVEVYQSEGFGKILLNDDLVMVSERDEFIYHDMISHVPLFSHPQPESVLIIGGGDGGTAREVLRHKGVSKCVMVEIDQAVVDSCKEFIPQTSSALEDSRLSLLIEDGVKFVENTKDKFDVIIIDSTDPVGPAQPLFGKEFYANVKKCLNQNGIVVAQGESPFFHQEMQQKLAGIAQETFSIVGFYNFTNLTYPGGLWSFMFASDECHPINGLQEERIEKSGLKFQYYNSQIHKAAFCLPEFQRQSLRQWTRL